MHSFKMQKKTKKKKKKKSYNNDNNSNNNNYSKQLKIYNLYKFSSDVVQTIYMKINKVNSLKVDRIMINILNKEVKMCKKKLIYSYINKMIIRIAKQITKTKKELNYAVKIKSI